MVSEIGMGLLVFIGVHGSDTESDANYMYVESYITKSVLWFYFFQYK